MNGTDFPVLQERLNELADALGGKQITPKGLAVWVQTLREFPLPDVVDVLSGWAKTSPRMPAPADVWKVLNVSRAEKLEAKAIAEKRRFQVEAAQTFRRNDETGQKLRGLLKDMQEQPQSALKEWAHVLWARFVADRKNSNGSEMNFIQIRFACEALNRPIQAAYEAREERRQVIEIEPA